MLFLISYVAIEACCPFLKDARVHPPFGGAIVLETELIASSPKKSPIKKGGGRTLRSALIVRAKVVRFFDTIRPDTLAGETDFLATAQ